MKIHPLDHITTRLEYIQTFLESPYDSDSGNLLVARLNDLDALMAESGKLRGDAEYHYNAKLEGEVVRLIRELLPKKISSTVQNSFLKSCAKEESRIVTIADRINRACVHQMDSLRTQISYQKSLPR